MAADMQLQEMTDIAAAAVDACPADQAEAVVVAGTEAVTRFANNAIHQNTAEERRRVTVRAVKGKRIGCASGDVACVDDAVRVARTAAEMAEVAREIPDFVSLPSPGPIAQTGSTAAVDVVSATASDRAELVAVALQIAKENELVAAGALTTYYSALAVVNSLGVRAARARTAAHFHTVMSADDGAGYAASEGPALADVRVEATARRAAAKALASRNPIHVAAEPMPVVLEPVAAAELIGVFAWGFSALAHQEERSFTCDLLGEQACSPQFSLTDDGLDPRGYLMPFDFEGIGKKRVELVASGVINDLVYDSYTAQRASPQRTSTGHASPPPGRWGPMPTNLFVHPGPSSLDDLIASVDRGLLVSRVHYLNVVHPRKMILTGMTREGTFLIERGQVSRPVHNLRFTEQFVDALSRLQGIGADGELHGSVWTPALLIDGFAFTSETQF